MSCIFSSSLHQRPEDNQNIIDYYLDSHSEEGKQVHCPVISRMRTYNLGDPRLSHMLSGSRRHKKIIIMLLGFPGSGKSALARMLLGTVAGRQGPHYPLEPVSGATSDGRGVTSKPRSFPLLIEPEEGHNSDKEENEKDKDQDQERQQQLQRATVTQAQEKKDKKKKKKVCRGVSVSIKDTRGFDSTLDTLQERDRCMVIHQLLELSRGQQVSSDRVSCGVRLWRQLFPSRRAAYKVPVPVFCYPLNGRVSLAKLAAIVREARFLDDSEWNGRIHLVCTKISSLFETAEKKGARRFIHELMKEVEVPADLQDIEWQTAQFARVAERLVRDMALPEGSVFFVENLGDRSDLFGVRQAPRPRFGADVSSPLLRFSLGQLHDFFDHLVCLALDYEPPAPTPHWWCWAAVSALVWLLVALVGLCSTAGALGSACALATSLTAFMAVTVFFFFRSYDQ